MHNALTLLTNEHSAYGAACHGRVAVKLTVLGCAGTFPGPDRACSSYVIEHEGFRLLIDVGNGALGPLQQHIGLLNVNAVLVSHLHGDTSTALTLSRPMCC